MLTPPLNKRGQLIALMDDADPKRIAVAAAYPAFVDGQNGQPGIRLLRWALAGSAADNAGAGRLDLEIAVNPKVADLAGLEQFTVEPIPWHDARIRLEGPRFEPVESDVSILSGGIGVAAVDLDPQAASILSALLSRSTVSPLQIIWSGRVLVRLPAVEVVASCSSTEIRRRTDTVRGAHSSSVVRTLIQANAHIEIRGGSDAALEEALRDWALDELLRRFEAAEDLSLKRSASDVVLWPIRIAATLDQIMPEQAEQIVQTHLLEADEIGFPPPVDIRVLADFSGPLERVDVQLEPLGRGRPAEAGFTDGEPKRLALRTRDFRWRRRLKYASEAAGEWSAWISVERRSALLIPVEQVADLRIEVVAAGLDFERRWSAVQVHLQHHGRTNASQSIELSRDRRSGDWVLPLRQTRQRVSAKLKFVSQDGQVLEQNIEQVTGNHVVVADPFVGHRRRIALIPVGAGWRDAAAAMIDLRYRDGEQVSEATIPLSGPDDFAEWEAPARPEGPKAVEWRSHISFHDGRFESSDWGATDDGVLAIPLQQPAKRELQILPVFFDVGTTAQIEIVLRSGEFRWSDQLIDRTARTVLLPMGPYRWSAVWTFTDGARRAISDQLYDEDVLVVPHAPETEE